LCEGTSAVVAEIKMLISLPKFPQDIHAVEPVILRSPAVLSAPQAAAAITTIAF